MLDSATGPQVGETGRSLSDRAPPAPREDHDRHGAQDQGETEETQDDAAGTSTTGRATHWLLQSGVQTQPVPSQLQAPGAQGTPGVP